MPTVAIASEFLDAFASIPRAQQRKVREFTEKFRHDPRSSGINYEKIQDSRDDKVRTVRIGLDYRGVVLHPERGDVYVLIWVDHHDEAMAWARNKRFEINRYTGALQVININEIEEVVTEVEEVIESTNFLKEYDDDLLLSFGVPELLLPAVRAVESQDKLLALGAHLPAEATEALYWLADGLKPGEVKDALEQQSKTNKVVDTDDFEKALDHPDSKRRFKTIASQQNLAAMLNAPLEKWRIFLHPSQEKLVQWEVNGPIRVLGGAGTGKTVVAMHRARYLVQSVFTEKTDRILFTTYTANLAKNIESNLGNLCGDEGERVEVVHLHSWAVRFMRTQGIEFNIVNDKDKNECWQEAVAVADEVDWDIGFLRQEWEQVIQTHGISDKQKYLRISRVGRGKTLSRPQRAKIWEVFAEYREALRSRGKFEWLDVIRETRRYLEEKQHLLPYRSLVVDEAQDFHIEEWRLIRCLVPEGKNDLFIVGDAHQRIYGRRVVLGQCGINIRGRARKLRVNYRTTEQIRDWAVALLEGIQVDDLDGGSDNQEGYHSLLSGVVPDVKIFESLEEEQAFIGELLRELLIEYEPQEICLVARTNSILGRDYIPLVEMADIPRVVLGQEDIGEKKGIRIATMHRVKGLEFPCIIICGANDGVIPLTAPWLVDDPTGKVEHEERERSLLFVAATRARDRLMVTAAGMPSPYILAKPKS
jgi:superfamily I DNA/RNA helicase